MYQATHTLNEEDREQVMSGGKQERAGTANTLPRISLNTVTHYCSWKWSLKVSLSLFHNVQKRHLLSHNVHLYEANKLFN